MQTNNLMNRFPPTVAVFGAGISGLTCARALADHGVPVTVFEKSRDVGGRMATRRSEQGAPLDHGAQFFTVRDERFRSDVDSFSIRRFRGSPETAASPAAIRTRKLGFCTPPGIGLRAISKSHPKRSRSGSWMPFGMRLAWEPCRPAMSSPTAGAMRCPQNHCLTDICSTATCRSISRPRKWAAAPRTRSNSWVTGQVVGVDDRLGSVRSRT